MRINKFLAQASGLSRRAADGAIQQGRVAINHRQAKVGDTIADDDVVSLDNKIVTASLKLTIMLNKPAGYVCSRRGQGSSTIYELLPATYHRLKPVGRLDKASSGLLLLTDDGDLANRLTHPRHTKAKVYEITLDRPLVAPHQNLIVERGVQLADGLSRFKLAAPDNSRQRWRITMHEGRNRQIRRTFKALGYDVTTLHRTQVADYRLQDLRPGRYAVVDSPLRLQSD